MQPTRFCRPQFTQNHRDWVYKSFHLSLCELPSDKGLIGPHAVWKVDRVTKSFASSMSSLRAGLGLRSLVVDLALRRWQCAYGRYRRGSSRHVFRHWQCETKPPRRFFQLRLVTWARKSRQSLKKPLRWGCRAWNCACACMGVVNPRGAMTTCADFIMHMLYGIDVERPDFLHQKVAE